MKDTITAKGFFRLQIKEGNKVIGDSGWKKNQITNNGFQNYIVGSLGAIAGSSQASYLALGTGGVPAATDTALGGELSDAAALRMTVAPSAVSSKTLRLVGSLNSGVVTTTHNISNIGIFAVSTTAAGTLMAGNTYASSLLNTNQTVNSTYEVRFS